MAWPHWLATVTPAHPARHPSWHRLMFAFVAKLRCLRARDLQRPENRLDRLVVNEIGPPYLRDRFHNQRPKTNASDDNRRQSDAPLSRGSFWMKITPQTGSLFHEESHSPRWLDSMPHACCYRAASHSKRLPRRSVCSPPRAFRKPSNGASAPRLDCSATCMRGCEWRYLRSTTALCPGGDPSVAQSAGGLNVVCSLQRNSVPFVETSMGSRLNHRIQ